MIERDGLAREAFIVEGVDATALEPRTPLPVRAPAYVAPTGSWDATGDGHSGAGVVGAAGDEPETGRVRPEMMPDAGHCADRLDQSFADLERAAAPPTERR